MLRRYRRRWKVERLFAWLHNYRRIVTRLAGERHPENFLAMVHYFASAIILLEAFMRWLLSIVQPKLGNRQLDLPSRGCEHSFNCSSNR